MANEPDGAGTRDNLDVIRELLRRLEEAAHSRTLASSDSPQNPNRELASVRDRAPPTRLAHNSPPSIRSQYYPLDVFPIEAVARWRLPIVAIGAYALGVASTLVLVAVTSYDRLSPVAGEVLDAPQPAKSVALAPSAAVPKRPPMEPAKEAAARPAPRPEAPAAQASATPQPVKPVPPPDPSASAAPQPGTPRSAVQDGAAPQPGTRQSAAPVASPPAAQQPLPVDAAQSPAGSGKSAGLDKRAAKTTARAGPDPGARPEPTDFGSAPFMLRLASKVEIRGGERAPFPVTLEPLPADADAMLLVVRGVPEEMALSQGSAIGNEIWLIPAHVARDLEFTIANTLSGSFDLSAELVSIDGQLLAQSRMELVAAPAAPSTPGTPRAIASQQIDADTLRRLTARGELLLDTGDIGAARIVLERAAEAGSAIAALRLGETYDPAYLQRMGAKVDAGDETRAQRWYEQAERLGSPRAAERLSELRKR